MVPVQWEYRHNNDHIYLTVWINEAQGVVSVHFALDPVCIEHGPLLIVIRTGVVKRHTVSIYQTLASAMSIILLIISLYSFSREYKIPNPSKILTKRDLP
jgi:hypothetical protein